VKKPKSVPKPETKCFYCKGTGHWRRNCPKYLVDKKDGKVNKGILDIHVIDVYLLVFIATPQYLILVQLLKSSNLRRELQNKQRLVKVNKGIFDIQIIDVYFTSVYSNPSVFDTSLVAKISNSKQELQNK
jgi:hypothetical protein